MCNISGVCGCFSLFFKCIFLLPLIELNVEQTIHFAYIIVCCMFYYYYMFWSLSVSCYILTLVSSVVDGWDGVGDHGAD